MSKLEAIKVLINGQPFDMYFKSDVDEVLAEKDKQLRHQKYKRCLDMERISQDDWHLHNTFYAMGHQEFEKRKCQFYEKWHNRWLELAEKFKDKEA